MAGHFLNARCGKRRLVIEVPGGSAGIDGQRDRHRFAARVDNGGGFPKIISENILPRRISALVFPRRIEVLVEREIPVPVLIAGAPAERYGGHGAPRDLRSKPLRHFGVHAADGLRARPDDLHVGIFFHKRLRDIIGGVEHVGRIGGRRAVCRRRVARADPPPGALCPTRSPAIDEGNDAESADDGG